MIVRSTRWFALLAAVATAAPPSSPTGEVTLADLYQESAIVAVVRVTGGDVSGFEGAVCRAEVLEAFKGVAPAETIYFTPADPCGVGSEYVLFLGKTDRTVFETFKRGPSPWPLDGTETLYPILRGGYGALPIQYTCILPGCDHAVSVAGSQVRLPAGAPSIRYRNDPGSRYDTWVEKSDFLALLAKMRGAP